MNQATGPRISFLLQKLIWMAFFKLYHFRSPLSIKTSYEHLHLKRVSPSPDIVIDVGFNTGQFSSLALELWPLSTVIAFDPHPTASNRSAQLLSDRYKSRFRFFNLALSNISGNANFNISSSPDNSSMLAPTNLNLSLYSQTKLVDSCSVKTDTLSSFAHLYLGSCTLLKIDVQGSELQVLKGLKKSDYLSIYYIYIEVSDCELYEGQASRDELTKYLASFGYKPISFHNNNYIDGRLIYSDILFKRLP